MKATRKTARLRGRYGIFRVIKNAGVGYWLEVLTGRQAGRREWRKLELYDYLGNAREVARALCGAMTARRGWSDYCAACGFRTRREGRAIRGESRVFTLTK